VGPRAHLLVSLELPNRLRDIRRGTGADPALSHRLAAKPREQGCADTHILGRSSEVGARRCDGLRKCTPWLERRCVLARLPQPHEFQLRMGIKSGPRLGGLPSSRLAHCGTWVRIPLAGAGSDAAGPRSCPDSTKQDSQRRPKVPAGGAASSRRRRSRPSLGRLLAAVDGDLPSLAVSHKGPPSVAFQRREGGIVGSA
jgi:hypothetical protein